MSDTLIPAKHIRLYAELEARFSLHDTEAIFELLTEFYYMDTQEDTITFEDFLNNKIGELNKRERG